MSRTWAGWTAALDAGRPVELTAGDRLVVRVDAVGVLLPEPDLLVPWMHLGSAFGVSTERFSSRPGSLALFVSRTWWTDELGHPRPSATPAVPGSPASRRPSAPSAGRCRPRSSATG